MIDAVPNAPKMLFERSTDPDKFDVKMDAWQKDFQHAMQNYNIAQTLSLCRDDCGGYFYPHPMPIVIIVNGTARSGKDTFVDVCEQTYEDSGYYPACVRMSSVDKCYEAVNGIFLKGDTRPEVVQAIKNKEDAWRQFMHEVKMSWSKFCNGPTQYIINQLKDYTDCDNTPAFVFMFLREAAEIKTLVDTLKVCGYLTLTVFISGHVQNTDWNNDCDHNVTLDAYPYDVHIENTSTLEEYKDKCKKFMEQMIAYRNTAKSLPEFRKYLKASDAPQTLISPFVTEIHHENTTSQYVEEAFVKND